MSESGGIIRPVTTKHSDFGSLTDRVAGTDGVEGDRPLPAGAHVWVRTDGKEAPGLLAGWRQGAGDWWGRVVTVTDGQSIETLVRADLLRKA